MLEQAKPIIERELKMTFPEKFLSRVTGNRSEKRETKECPCGYAMVFDANSTSAPKRQNVIEGTVIEDISDKT